MGLRSGLFVPLLVGDRAIGVIAAHNRRGADPRFTDEDLRLAETFAARAAVAVDLADRVARDALRRVVEGQELERARLARELHDETGQALTSILLGLKRGRGRDGRRGRARGRRGARGRRSSRRCRTSAGSPSSCGRRRSTTSASCPRSSGWPRRSREQSGIEVEVEAHARRGRACPPEVETALYRIVQEALTNVAKHAGATHVSIVLTRRDGSGDRGRRGRRPGLRRRGGDGDGLGLVGMRERVGLLGGRLAVESTEGSGTTIVAEVPLR